METLGLEGHHRILESSYLDEKEISPKVDTSNFFIESSYTDKANRTNFLYIVMGFHFPIILSK
ncbi:hypothetical protein [Clostridium butyricum]|uniref:hypothetical protein n=1 Tax=Clostridium butyricum TaxID=1492 RepID=UPI00325B0D54